MFCGRTVADRTIHRLQAAPEGRVDCFRVADNSFGSMDPPESPMSFLAEVLSWKMIPFAFMRFCGDPKITHPGEKMGSPDAGSCSQVEGHL
jgi:hypothetical protein